MIEPQVENRPVFLVGKHHYAYRQGEPGRASTIAWVVPQGGKPRVAVQVLYADGGTDWVAMQDIIDGSYEFVSGIRLRYEVSPPPLEES